MHKLITAQSSPGLCVLALCFAFAGWFVWNHGYQGQNMKKSAVTVLLTSIGAAIFWGIDTA